jgi:cytochrome P450
MSLIQAPRRVPVLGHIAPLALKRMSYLQSLRPLGDIVTVYAGPHPVHVLNSPRAIHEVLVVQGENFDQGRLFENLGPFLGNSVLTCPREQHLGQRRTLQPSFSRAAVTGYCDFMAESAQELVGAFSDGAVIDAVSEMYRLSVLVSAKLLFSAEDVAGVPAQIERALPLLIAGVMRRTLMPAEFLNKIPTPAARRYGQAGRNVRDSVSQVIARYRAAGTDRGDVLSTLIAHRDEDGAALTDEQIRDQLITLFMAGSDTVASTMCYFFHALAGSPQARAVAEAEVDDVLQGRTPTAGDLHKMPYLRNAISETMRLYHPVWFLTRRCIGPATIAGHEFKAGSDFIYSIAALHRDPDLYPDPLSFRPERWDDAPPDRHAFLPFGAGARKCIGDNLAMSELAILLATFLQRWRLEPAEDRAPRPVLQAVIHPDRLKMRMVRRDTGAGGLDISSIKSSALVSSQVESGT